MTPTLPLSKRTLLAALGAAVAFTSLAGCKENAPAESAPSTGAAPAAAQKDAAQKMVLTVLVTGDEAGWLLPTTESGAPKGGAAELLGQWLSRDPAHPEAQCNLGSILRQQGRLDARRTSGCG